MISTGGHMGTLFEKNGARKSSSKAVREPKTVSLTANQRRFLNAAMTSDVEEPSLLAGSPDKPKA